MLLKVIASSLKAMGMRIKKCSAKEYLSMIRPYLSDKINDHNTLKKLGVYSSNEVFHYETRYGEWKIQLAMSTDFTSSKDSNECRNMHKKLM